jgi:hypothetical protein
MTENLIAFGVVIQGSFRQYQFQPGDSPRSSHQPSYRHLDFILVALGWISCTWAEASFTEAEFFP